MMQRMTKEELARAADKARGVKRGIEGINILIYGWLKWRKYSPKYYEAVRHREWLYITEALDLSAYAGCDLTKMES